MNQILDLVAFFYSGLCAFAVSAAALVPVIPHPASWVASGLVALGAGGLSLSFRRLFRKK